MTPHVLVTPKTVREHDRLAGGDPGLDDVVPGDHVHPVRVSAGGTVPHTFPFEPAFEAGPGRYVAVGEGWTRARPPRLELLAAALGDLARRAVTSTDCSWLSIGSRGSVLSIGSVASFGSIGSVGSFLSIGSAWSSMSIGSLASNQSMFSALSHQCKWSLLSFQSQRSLLSSRSQR